MPHAARPTDRRILPRAAALGPFGLLALSLAGCPAPPPSSADAAPRGEPTPAEPAAEPAAPEEPAQPSQARRPSPAKRSPAASRQALDPAPAPAPGPAAPLPPALAAEGVRPVVQALWRALEAVDAGDAHAMARAMTPTGRWFPPGSLEESVHGATDLARAMGPWTSDTVELDVRRVIDPGGSPFVAQVAATAKGSEIRYELALVVEVRDDRIAAVHHYGDPLGPVRLGPAVEEPLDLGPVGQVELVRDEPMDDASGEPAALATALVKALDGRKDAATRALLAEDVVLHDVTARRTRRGRAGYLAGYEATLGKTGHLVVDRQHVAPGFVVIEGALHGLDPDAEAPQEHGFADVHRVIDGAIVETWHYVNRRSRPHRPRAQP